MQLQPSFRLVIERLALRLCLDLLSYLPKVALYAKAGLAPLESRFLYLSASALAFSKVIWPLSPLCGLQIRDCGLIKYGMLSIVPNYNMQILCLPIRTRPFLIFFL